MRNDKVKMLVFHPVIAPYRIDFFNELYSQFGAEVCLFYRNLSSQKFDYEKIEKQLLFNSIYIEKKGSFVSWVKKIIHQLSVSKPNVVLVSELGVPTLITILYKFITFKRYKIVSMIDDSYDMVAGDKQFSWKHKYATKLLVPLLDEVINVEPMVTDFYNKKFKKGIFFPIIASDKIAKQRLEKVIPISNEYIKTYHLQGKKVFLFVGRLVKIKNVAFAIEAFIKANIPNSVFVIVGDGSERDNLESLAQHFENIIFTGRLEDDELYAWYNIAQCFTLPSLQEPFGAVTNEALQGGCKVLISKVAGSLCLVEEGKNGYLIDPKNMDDYIKKLISILDDADACDTIHKVRQNLMIYTFNDKFEGFYNKVQNLIK
mgnify:FL=1